MDTGMRQTVRGGHGGVVGGAWGGIMGTTINWNEIKEEPGGISIFGHERFQLKMEPGGGISIFRTWTSINERGERWAGRIYGGGESF